MRFTDTLATALAALRGNPIRTVLTMLGVVIGVACVVSMLAIGSGARARVQDQIRAFGANVLLVTPAPVSANGARPGAGPRARLTGADARALANLPNIRAAAPSVSGAAQVVSGSRNWMTTVNGTTADHFVIRNWSLREGRLFTQQESAQAAKVVILGSATAARLFDTEAPLGNVVRILNTPFTVIGVLSDKGADGSGQSQDDVAFVPLATATLRLIGSASNVDRDAVAYVIASAQSESALPAAMEDAKALLRRRHQSPDGVDDVVVTTAAAALAAQQASTRTIAILLGSIAVVSLIVGGISIMNIMLVCVSERTPEIGLRLAVGARPKDVRLQLLVESAALCVAGGLVGAAFGAATAGVVATSFHWPVALDIWTIIASIGLAAVIGVFFGWYPARRASLLSPIDALKRL